MGGLTWITHRRLRLRILSRDFVDHSERLKQVVLIIFQVTWVGGGGDTESSELSLDENKDRSLYIRNYPENVSVTFISAEDEHTSCRLLLSYAGICCLWHFFV